MRAAAEEGLRDDAFTVSLFVTIRLCDEDDLPKLEWFGQFTEHRNIIRRAYERQQRGENVMLVADVRGEPVGQVWIDLVQKRREATGMLWAVRVFPWLRNLGIGTRLITAAEGLLRHLGYTRAELGVERDNAGGRRFYERLGYRPVGTRESAYSYTTPDGEFVRIPLDEWMLRKHLKQDAAR